MANSLPKPPYDMELSARLDASTMTLPDTLTEDLVKRLRAGPIFNTSLSTVLSIRQIEHQERQIPSPKGSKTLTLFIFHPKNTCSKPRGCIYWLHGGGLILGSPLSGLSFPLEVAQNCGLVCVSVDYGLAPEHPYPVALQDCYAGIRWINEHAEELGIDQSRVMISGTSAGGGLALATALLCRDDNGPALFAMCLKSPMLDDRDLTMSKRQFAENKIWSRRHNSYGWESYLGKHYQGPDVSIYAAPGRAEDLSHLPPTYLDAGSAELFRDDTVSCASKLWTSGVQAELHIWPGAYHGFESSAPKAALSIQARETRMTWIEKMFGKSVEP